jgi:integrase
MTTKKVRKRRDGRRDFGSAREQTNGRWQARYTAPDGSTVTGPHTFGTRTDATLWLDSERDRINRGTWSNPKASKRLLGDYAAEWLVHRKGRKGRELAPRTRELYADLLRLHIVGDDDNQRIPPPSPRLGSMPIGEITYEDVRRWHTDRGKYTGETQVRQAYSLLRAIFNTAVKDKLIQRDNHPCLIEGAGSPEEKERDLLEWDHVQALADTIEPYLRTAVLLAFDAHLRQGELLALQRRDIDLNGQAVKVRRQVVRTKEHGDPEHAGKRLLIETAPKADSVRTVDLSDWCTALMRQHLDATAKGAHPTARVFRFKNGTVLQPHHVQKAWREARTKVGLDWAHFHDLRAAGLTLVAQLGATVKETQGRAGHSTVRASMIYQRKASAKRGRVLADLLSAYAEQQVKAQEEAEADSAS